MNLDPFLPWALSGVSGVLGWFIRVLWQANKELAADLTIATARVAELEKELAALKPAEEAKEGEP